jgi:hypothetical protein
MQVSSFSVGIDLRELRRALSCEPLDRFALSIRGLAPQIYGVVRAGDNAAVRGAMVKYVVIGFLLIFVPGLLVGWLWLLLH